MTFTFSEAVVPGSVTLARCAREPVAADLERGQHVSDGDLHGRKQLCRHRLGSGGVVHRHGRQRRHGRLRHGRHRHGEPDASPGRLCVDASLNDGDTQSVVTFTFSEAVVPGSVTLAVAHGSLSALIWNADNTSATATFTAENSFAGTGSVQVVSFTDTAGNAGTGGSDTVGIDTANPTVVVFGVGDASLNDGNPQSLVTFTFSEAVVPGSVTLAVAHGSLSALIWNGNNTSATATFTAADGFAGTGSVQVVSFTDTAGNAGTGGSDTVSIDTENPTVVVDILDLSLIGGDNSSLVKFTFSEVPTGFTNADVTFVGGTLTAVTSGSGARSDGQDLHRDLHGDRRLQRLWFGFGDGRQLHRRGRQSRRARQHRHGAD